MDEHTSTITQQHLPCPHCGSSDAYCVYDDGHGFCFSCKATDQEGVVTERKSTPKAAGLIDRFRYAAIPSRRITEAACRSHGYALAEVNGQTVQIANYKDVTGCIVGQKVKAPGKRFSVRGNLGPAGLWQQSRWRPGGKQLLICEGETDLLAWQSISGDRFPAVSLPSGATSATGVIKKQIEYIESFDRVVLCFDNDEPGQTAAKACAEILVPGKACIMKVPEPSKDICEAVQAGDTSQLIDAFWQATPVRPDGIAGSDELLDALLHPPQRGYDYPWKGLSEMCKGLRRRELVTLTAGTGVGKSHVAGVIAHNLIEQGVRIGYISLEESLTRTIERLVGLELKQQLHHDRSGVTDEILTQTWNEKFAGHIVAYNHFGSLDAEQLLRRVRYMRIAEGVEFIILDHLSILVSGWGDGDERRLIDNVMTSLRSICEQTGVGMILISHLRQSAPGAKTHEEGGRPKLSELRGSGSIKQLSDIVIALVRDQMGTNPHASDVWVMKNRYVGITGRACELSYDPATGLMTETNNDQF